MMINWINITEAQSWKRKYAQESINNNIRRHIYYTYINRNLNFWDSAVRMTIGYPTFHLRRFGQDWDRNLGEN